MVGHNSYVNYKRDTRYLVYWLIHTSNTIIKNAPTPENGPPPVASNTTGQTTVAGLVAMAELIGKHMSAVPSTILRLLQSVISARSAFHANFQQFATSNPDAWVQKSNATHKFFIEALTRAFKALGGDVWASQEQATSDTEADDDNDVESLKDIIFANQFSALGLETAAGDDASDEEEEAVPTNGPASQPRRAQRKAGAGKKGKKGKKSRKKQQKPAQVKETSLDEVPLESYRIIEDEDGITTDYLIAVYSITSEWAKLRSYIKGVWREVAYQGLNSAVAGVLTNLAVGMVKQTELDIFVDFPGHDSYETVMQTITRGNIEKAQGMFTTALYRVGPDNKPEKIVQETSVDVREQVLVNAYRDLVDFITDYQKTRSGKPTKTMQAETAGWLPYLDLQNATREQRLKWRRSYTINWLYDLVNVFSGVVVQRIRLKGERHVLEHVDWSPSGPWGEHRVMFGINDFAAFVTSLAMQKPGTDVRKKILPHHVFQLQCIVDAFTVSRGWSCDVLRGHVLETPARGFRARRDLDLFLDRNNENGVSGFLASVDFLKQIIEKKSVPISVSGAVELLKDFQYDFINWLGETKYMYGLDEIPPSRFTSSNSNGLWEYSPFLCGVGLMEGLELAFRTSMMLWDFISEPVLLVHLHNMLVKKGYVKKPIGLFENLQNLLTDDFFVGGKIPDADFGRALAEWTEEYRLSARRQDRTVASRAKDIHALIDVGANKSFKKKSNLLLYREAGWDLDRIPDRDLNPISFLAMVRIAHTKYTVDPKTGKKQLPDTELIRKIRLKVPGIQDDDIIMIGSKLQASREEKEPAAKLLKSIHGMNGFKPFSDAEFKKGGAKGQGTRQGLQITGAELLEGVKMDLHNDICGESEPLSGINYVCIAAVCLVLFMGIEKELDRLRNPVYVRVYETEREWSRVKRAGLVTVLMAEEDEQCLQVIADEFRELGAGLMNHIYWKGLRSVSEMLDGTSPPAYPAADCTIL